MAGEITIERGLQQIKDGIAGIKAETKAADTELRAIDNALKTVTDNAERTKLLARQQELLAEKLKLAKQESEFLTEKTQELRIAMDNGEYATERQKTQLTNYETQLKSTNHAITGLTAATQQQTVVQETATLSTDTFKNSMTEFNSALSLATQTSKGLNSLYTLMGGSGDSTFGKMLKILPQITTVTKGVAAAMKLAAIATGSWKSALTMGVAAAAIVAGIVAIERATNKATAGIESASASDISSSISTSRTPIVSSYSGSVSSGGAGAISVQTLSQRQVTDAVYEALTRYRLEQRINEPTRRPLLTKAEILREIFTGILNPQTGTINATVVL